MKLAIGTRVELKTFQLLSQKGEVRYVGPVEGLPSTQVGVALDLPKGKHNGAWNGKTFFSCAPNHGVFVTLSQLRVLESPKPQAVPKILALKKSPTALELPSKSARDRPPLGSSRLKRPTDRSRTPVRTETKSPLKTARPTVSSQKTLPTAVSLSRNESFTKPPPAKKTITRQPRAQAEKPVAVPIQLNSASTKSLKPVRTGRTTEQPRGKQSTTFEFSDQEEASPKATPRRIPAKSPLRLGTTTREKREVVPKRTDISTTKGRSGNVSVARGPKREEATGAGAGGMKELERKLKQAQEDKVREVAKARTETKEKEKAILELREKHKEQLRNAQETFAIKLNGVKASSSARPEGGAELKEELVRLRKELEELRIAHSRVLEEKQTVLDDSQDFQAQLETAKEERDLLRLKLEQSESKAELEETSEEVSADLADQNGKLKAALRSLSGQLEMERASRAAELVELRSEVEKARSMRTTLEEKETDVNLLLEELEEKEVLVAKKEAEIHTLQEAMEQRSDLELMVEELTNNVLEREDQVDELRAKLRTARQELILEEEATTEAEKLAEMLQHQLELKDYSLQQQSGRIEVLVGRIEGLEGSLANYKAKMSDMAEQKDHLALQLAGSGELKDEMHQLLDNALKQTQRLREAHREQLLLKESLIDHSARISQLTWATTLLPVSMKTQLEHFHRPLVEVPSLSKKAALLSQEVARVLSAPRRGGDHSDTKIFFWWNCELYFNIIALYDVLRRITPCLASLSETAYAQLEWGHINAAGAFVEKWLRLIRQENLSPSTSLAPFTATVGAVQDFFCAIQDSASLQDGSLALSRGLLLIRLAVLALPRHFPEQDTRQQVQRIAALLSKLEGTSEPVQQVAMGLALERLFEQAQSLWRGEDAAESVGAAEDWEPWLERIEAELGVLERQSWFKSAKSPKGEEDSFLASFAIGAPREGLWSVVGARIRTDLAEAATYAGQVKTLSASCEDMKQKLGKAGHENKDLRVIRQTLEHRVAELEKRKSELEHRALRIPALEDENARLNENLALYQQSIQECRDQIQDLEKEQNSRPEVIAARHKRMETVAARRQSKMEFYLGQAPAVVVGDRGYINAYRDLLRKICADHSEVQRSRSLKLLNKLEVHSSAFNRFIQAERPQNLSRVARLREAENCFLEALWDSKAQTGQVKVVKLDGRVDALQPLRQQGKRRLALAARMRAAGKALHGLTEDLDKSI